jgi:hypothetical protein
MSDTKSGAGGSGEHGIYLDAARNWYMGAVSLGYGPEGMRIRRKVFGKTKQDVRDKSLDGTSEQTRTLYERPVRCGGTTW